MSKKLMLLAAGVLAALAFTALPSVASAQEAELKCEGAGACTFTVHGTTSEFSLTNGDTVRCTTVTGSGQMTNLNADREATTGDVQLLFHECKEQASGFQFKCTNTGTAGTVTTNNMVFHLITTSDGHTHVLLTDATTTFTCAGGFASTQVTGNVIGEVEETCGSTPTPAGNVLHMNFTKTAHGQQTLKTYTGATFDLEGKTSHTGGGSYLTAAQTGTGTLTFNQNVTPTC